MRAALAPGDQVPTSPWVLTNNGGSPEKMRIDRAQGPDWKEFYHAMMTKVDALCADKKQRLFKRESGMTITPTTMLRERKRGATGKVTSHIGRDCGVRGQADPHGGQPGLL